MDWQAITAIIMGIIALGVVARSFRRQMSHVERDPKCEDCPIPEIQKNREK